MPGPRVPVLAMRDLRENRGYRSSGGGGREMRIVIGGVRAMSDETAALIGYVRFDDQHDDGQLSQFCERLAAEVRAQTGGKFAIFQDRNDIAWGQNWQQRIDAALDTVALLLVIITPSLFRSPACREEFEKFLDREHALDRVDLILPVYYISAR